MTLALFLLLFTTTAAHALPPPPSIEELCKKSNVILLGTYLAAEPRKPKNCKFEVIYNIFPERFFKKPFPFGLEGSITYRQQYYVDSEQCRIIPGPNATPDSIKAMVKQNNKKRYIFFLSVDQPDNQEFTGVTLDVVNPFYSVKAWGKDDKNFKKQFNQTRGCKGFDDGGIQL